MSHGQHVPIFYNLFCREILLNIHSKPPLVQLGTISCHPLKEKRHPQLATPSLQVVRGSDRASPEPPLLQYKQPQLPEPLLLGLVPQIFHQLHCPSLDTFQQFSVFPLVSVV